VPWLVMAASIAWVTRSKAKVTNAREKMLNAAPELADGS
jgi:hypothetical protein